jgi:hypothetical protein
LRMPASVLPRQSVSPAMSWSIRSDGFMRSLPNQPSNDMAFPHPQSGKKHYRNDDKPYARSILRDFFKRTINIPDYRNAKDDVYPAKNRTLGGFSHDFLHYDF